MSCWEFLGLAPGADTRSIKRQYALLLKQHRPDEDPQGFQRLREAYEQALDWSHNDDFMALEAPEVVLLETLPPFEQVPVSSGPSIGQQLAAQLLENASVANLADRYQQAKSCYCAHEFEVQLLSLCLDDTEQAMELSQWGLEHFHWLNLWLRDDHPALPLQALEQLLARTYLRIETTLCRLLDLGQAEAFSNMFLNLSKAEWLRPLERHDWLNAMLARTLLASWFWSEDLFETICVQQGWKSTGSHSRCPHPEWEQLLERSHHHGFIVEQRRLAKLDLRNPQCRAAKMLFAPLTHEQRHLLARRFMEADWNACRFLSARILTQYPHLCREMPEGDPYFWRAWEGAGSTWPMYAALAGMGVGQIIGDQLNSTNAMASSLGAALFWMAMMAIPMVVVLWLWIPVADRHWSLDQRWTQRLSPWLSPRRPAPMFLRQILPCWVMGLAVWAASGTCGLLGYGVTLLTLGALSRVPGKSLVKSLISRIRLQRNASVVLSAVMMGSVVLAVVGLLVYGNSQMISRDQGLQPIAMHLCAGLRETVRGCEVPATQAQWYGHTLNGQKKP
ncbi:J domain-containing protein [Pseudomonas sp. RW409]|nr:J domain-containing protein [Pseudomonas sp. RW409]